MRRPLFTQRRALVTTIVLLGIASFLPINIAGRLADPARDLLRLTTMPLAHPLKAVGDSVRGREPLPVQLGDADDYEWAKREIERLRQELDEATRQIAELSHMRQETAMRGNTLQRARVTGWSNRPMAPTLTLNRGTRDGVSAGYVVASGFNLVGRVTDTSSTGATVHLITAPTTPLTVRFVPSALRSSAPAGGAAVCELNTQTAGQGHVFVGVVPHDAPVRPGDLAKLQDPTWPAEAAGFIVGKVTTVDPHPDDPTLRKRVTVEPIRALAHLSEVVVVVPTGEEAVGLGG